MAEIAHVQRNRITAAPFTITTITQPVQRSIATLYAAFDDDAG
jgi:hypothetical protein